MMRMLAFMRDTWHLQILLLLIILGAAGFLALRTQMVPESYGERSGRYGPYRAAALDELAAQPMVLHSDATCLECHEDVGEERTDALHKTVSCMHCHGLGREHVVQARKAAESSELSVEPAEEWDGDFLTKVDLYVAKDRAACLVCHETIVGMPKKFMQIIVDEHLDDMGAEEPESRETCLECHGPHDTLAE